MALFQGLFPRLDVAVTGGSDPGLFPNQEWSAQSERYRLYYRYFSGGVLDDVVESESDLETRKYPLRINICRTIAMLNAYAVLGEWTDRVFTWRGLGGRSNVRDLDFLDRVSRVSFMNSAYVRQVLTHTVMGGAVWRITQAPDSYVRWKWTVVPPEFFFPVYSALDDELLELYVQFPITAKEAALRWGVAPKSDRVSYQEHWTKRRYEVVVEGEVVQEGPTVGGVIPYHYMPRVNLSGEVYGISALEDIMGLQDEINARMADVGDAMVRETHKDLIVSNIPGSVKSIKRQDGIVDLGVGLGNAKPEVHSYTRANIPSGSFEFVSTMLDFTRHAAMTPPVAFGEDEGSQRSGMTLVLRMWPMVQMARSNRAFVADALTGLAAKTMRLAAMAGVDVGTVVEYAPDFPPMLPKDREQAVNEVAILRAAQVISDERVVDLLDVPEDEQVEELERIRALRAAEQKMQMDVARQQMELRQRASAATRDGSAATKSGS